ncbi:MAG: hypothetical protein PHW04_07970 [Candidatus Wallbacteria bacterium]|nr:hypothetical protein [Candidatus Wallbacteria bacterium]
MKIHLRRARGLSRIYLKVMKFRALAWPPDTVYFVGDRPDKRLLGHECVHFRQYRREGLIRYFFRWWWQYFRVSYEKIDYELEARAAEIKMDFQRKET